MTDKFELDLQKKSLSKITEFFDQTKKILILTTQTKRYENISNKNKLSLEIPEIKFDDIECIHDYLSNENNLRTITKKQNYDIIVLDQILDFFDSPTIFLNNISKFLSPNGILVGCIYNFSNIINRIKFLDGEISNNNFISKYSSFLSLENLLFFLSNSNLEITKLDRIQNEVTLSNQTELKNYVLPIELINSINNDPESQTFFYVFSAIPNSNVNSQARKLISEFSKNLVTEKLNDIFTEISFNEEKRIAYLKQNNQEQYILIKYLKQGLSEKDSHIEQIIKDKDEIINSLEQSLAFKLIRIIDRLRGITR